MRKIVLCANEKPRRVLVYPMHDTRAHNASDARKRIFAVEEKRVDQRTALVTGCGMDDHARRLVYNYNIGVLVNDIKRNILSRNVNAFGLGDQHFNGVPFLDNAAFIGAIEAGETKVTLVSGNYVMPDGSDLNLQGKTLTIVGDENTVLDLTGIDERDQFVTGATLVFEGVTLNFGTANYMGFANATSLVYRDCTINGLQFLYGPSVTFENCVLNSNGAEHCVWTWGVQNVSFTDCDFTYGDRAVNCYGEGVTTNASFTNCTFTKVAGKETTGAIETNSSTLTALNLTIENCTVNEGDLWWVSVWDGKNGANTNATVK